MIKELIIYLVVFGILYTAFYIVKSSGKFLANRILLLLIPLISLIIPFISFKTSAGVANSIKLPEIQAQLNSISTPVSNSIDYLGLLWMIGALICMGILIPRIIVSLKHNKTGSGYSFINRFYINDNLTDSLSTVIESHEKVHVQKGHSYDILFLELFRVVFWFNPLIHLLIRDVRLNHEYEADSLASQQHERYSEILVSQHFDIDHRLLGHSFGKSNLRKRLIMINKKKKTVTGRYIVYAVLVLSSLSLVSWNVQISSLSSDSLKINPGTTGDPDKKPEFIGGQDALIEYLSNAIKYPEEAKNDNIQGKVIVAFTVNQNGKIEKVRIEKSDNDIFNESAMKVIRNMPDWIPGEKDGKKVPVEMLLPISYKL